VLGATEGRDPQSVHAHDERLCALQQPQQQQQQQQLGMVQGATEGRDPHVHSDVAAESHDSVDCGSLESEADGDVSSCCGAEVHCHASSLSVGTDAEEKSIVNEAFVSGMVLGATEGRDPQSAAEAAQPRSAVVSVPLLSSGLRPSVAPNTLP
jgi:hypothetical protein